MVFMTYHKYGIGDETREVIISFSQYFTPILACWWVFSSLIKYIDGEGNEVFYIQKRMKWKEIFGFLLLYIVSNTIPFIIYAIFFDDMWLEWIRIVIEIILFVSMAYCFSFAFHNISFAVVVIVVYAFSSVFFTGMQSSLWMYYDIRDMTLAILKSKYLLLLGVSIIFYGIGMILNYKKESYH